MSDYRITCNMNADDVMGNLNGFDKEEFRGLSKGI